MGGKFRRGGDTLGILVHLNEITIPPSITYTGMFFFLINLHNLFLGPNIWSMLENVPSLLVKVYSASVGWHVL